MKTILPVMFFCLFTVYAIAQPDNQGGNKSSSRKSGPQDLMLRIPSTEIPGDSLKYRKQPHFRLPERRPGQLLAEKEKPADNMPIVGSPKGHFPQMPVYKPDTTVHYTLKIKKIQGGKRPAWPASPKIE